MDPVDWGWEKTNDSLNLIHITKEPAPSYILDAIFCGCKKGCGTSCSYRKNGLSCTLACKVCRGIDCTNHSYNVTEDILLDHEDISDTENNDDNEENEDVDW